jgi:hypothetical protein
MGPAWSDANSWGDPKYDSTIEFGDIDGDGKADVCGRANDAVYCELSNGTAFPKQVVGPAWSDANGWGDPKYYQTFWTLGAAPPMAMPPGGTGGGSGSGTGGGTGGGNDSPSGGVPLANGDAAAKVSGGCSCVVTGAPAEAPQWLVAIGLAAIGECRWRRRPTRRPRAVARQGKHR